MAIDRKTVEYVAHLARIELTPVELEKFSLQLHNIIGFIDTLTGAKIEGVQPTSHILSVNNISRLDQPKASLLSANALANAPVKEGAFFVVPKIIE
jgi:aspartyl-tRNA(Asn)/glutamyl-tRNA(Gln) amidotransferase subunit C